MRADLFLLLVQCAQTVRKYKTQKFKTSQK